MSLSPAHAADVEEAALAALGGGDYRTVLDVLMRAYGASVYRYCRAMLGDAERAKDALQKTFVQVYEGLPRFERRCPLRNWVFTIARHRCLDEAKVWRRWTRRTTSLYEMPAERGALPAAADTAERRLLDDECRRVLARCLGELAPHIRDAVIQRYVEGLSYTEMADVSGDRPATLQARVTRALPALRRCVEKCGMTA